MACTDARFDDSNLPDPTACTVARIHDSNSPDPMARTDALVDDFVSTKKHAHIPADKNPRQFCPNHPGAQGLHPRVRSRAPTIKTKNPPDDSTQIVRGLRGSCQVHKPGVPHGLASQQKLGLADDIVNDAQLLGWPKKTNDRPGG